MEKILRRYEARAVGIEAYLLARDWRRAGEGAKFSPHLLRHGADFLDRAIRHGDKRSLQDLAKAVAVASRQKEDSLRISVGFSDWWKLQTLIYMLNHPSEAYRTRDIRAYLGTLGLKVSSLDFRRFCNRHGIARDERAGRPKNLK
jgi:hypothetical protein